MKESAALLGIVADALARIGGAVAAHPRSATEARIMADCDIPPPVTPQEAEWRAAWQRADAALREVIVERDRLLEKVGSAEQERDIAQAQLAEALKIGWRRHAATKDVTPEPN